MEKKKKLLIQTDFSLANTGFGRNAKTLLSYLYKTKKYDLVHYCCGINWSNQELNKTPWKSIGCLPDNPQELSRLNQDPNLIRMASYGEYNLDRVIKQEKPDVYIAVQDIWGVDFSIKKTWFEKINSVIWTTLDSLPILDTAIEAAKKVKNYWIWSNFATKDLNKKGFKQVKTLHGCLDSKNFFKMSEFDRKNLRNKFNISQDSFVIGFVFRNQLRKSVPNLLEGYSLWKKQNPNVKNTFLLLHTFWGEGWNILKLAAEYGIDKSEILTTYICRNCKQYEVKPFHGHDTDCRFCNAQKSQVTTSVGLGVTENELNEIYNLMNVYCHPFTSGGQEIPVQEAKLTELITLVTNYSCGEDLCEPEANSLSLDWSEYREHGTEFKKASTIPQSIADRLNQVYNFPKSKLIEMGKKAREWTLNNFSVDVVGKKIEDFIDQCPFIDYENNSKNIFNLEESKGNPNAQIKECKNDNEWILSLYHEVLNLKQIDENDEGFKHWINQIKNGMPKDQIEAYFRDIARKNSSQNETDKINELFDINLKCKKLVIVMPESAGDVYMATSLLPSVKQLYPNYRIYFSTKPDYFSILEGNEFIDKIIPYFQQMDDLMWLEGKGNHKGYFDIAFLPHAGTQRFLTYLHNGEDTIEFDVKNFNI